MDIVHASLTRRLAADATAATAPVAEVGEVVDIIWAHAGSTERLEHIGGRATAERVELLFFLLPCEGAGDGAGNPDESAERRAADLLHRSHQRSPLLQSRYLPPPQPAVTQP